MLLGQAMAAGTPGALNSRVILPALIVYVALAAAFVWLGIGSIRCRRWARALILILAWAWLCVGVITVPLMAFLMPRILSAPPASGQALPVGRDRSTDAQDRAFRRWP
jgi:CHASE2 domain-containing sensor protein